MDAPISKEDIDADNADQIAESEFIANEDADQQRTGRIVLFSIGGLAFLCLLAFLEIMK